MHKKTCRVIASSFCALHLDGKLLILYGTNMGQDSQAKPSKPNKAEVSREERLKAALKANMAKRKAQAKARAVQSDSEKEQ
jgi:hypothetical protein